MQGESMRIVCDYCSYPISGAVKKIAGNINLHPECLPGPSQKEQGKVIDGTLRNGKHFAARDGAILRRLTLATKRRKLRRNRAATLRRSF